MASTHLAFDLGAGSGRAMLGTLADGRLHVEEVHRFPTPLLEHGDRLTWDLGELWAEIRTGYERARRRAPTLASLSVDSWGCDYLPRDRDGVPLRDPYCYRDPRTAGMMARAQKAVPRSELYEVTGIQFMEENTLYQALADRILEPELTSRTATRLMIADYFSGTWSLLGVERPEPLLSDAAFQANFTNEAGAHGTVRFLRNLTGLWVLQECQRAWRASGMAAGYDELMREAEAAPSPGCRRPRRGHRDRQPASAGEGGRRPAGRRLDPRRGPRQLHTRRVRAGRRRSRPRHRRRTELSLGYS